MHFVPIDTALNNLVQRDFDQIPVEHLDGFFNAYEISNSSPYLFVDDNESVSIYFIDQPIRRQYLRYKASLSVGKEHLWDWVNHQGWDSINSALQTLPRYFKQI